MIELGKTVLTGLQSSYRIVEELDHGPVSSVYAGIEQEFGENVAVKTLPRKLDSKGLFKTNFRKEAKTLNDLHSSYIPTVRDWGEAKDYIFIVMEHVPGKTVARLLNESSSGYLEERLALDIAYKVGKALDVIQSRRISSSPATVA
jgi:serine/threonine protein kinase